MKRKILLALALCLMLAIPVSAQTGQKQVYGRSGEGRELVAWQYGDGENVLVMCFAIHGFEDNWDQDSQALVYSADQLREYLDKSSLPQLHGWTVYVLPCLNPDGLHSGWTNDGPGRCTTTYLDSAGNLIRGKGIDMNRCFPTGFRQMTNSRNFTGPAPMACLEARAISDFIQKVKGPGVNLLVDVHGWLEQTITTSTRIRSAVQTNFPTNRITNTNGGNGYLMAYAHSMGYESCLLELPRHFTNLNQYTSSDCTQRIIRTVELLLKSEKEVCSVKGHQWVLREQAASCTQAGYSEKICRACKEQERTDYPALGHSLTEGSMTVIAQPTASKNGLRVFDCSRCGTQGLTQSIAPVFRDVSAAAYYSDALDWCYEQAYIKGVSQSEFAPDMTLSRAMLVTILHRFAGEPESTGNTPFTDLQPEGYYLAALNWAYEAGIIQGTSATTFSPEEAVTREQVMTIFHRFVCMQQGDNGLREHTPFQDETALSDYALEAAHWSAANGIVVGDDKGFLRPGEGASRAQSVTMLLRLERYFDEMTQEEYGE